MTAATATAPTMQPGRRPRSITLGQLLERAHESARKDFVTECPVCDGPMRTRGREARCTGCGARLS